MPPSEPQKQPLLRRAGDHGRRGIGIALLEESLQPDQLSSAAWADNTPAPSYHSTPQRGLRFDEDIENDFRNVRTRTPIKSPVAVFQTPPKGAMASPHRQSEHVDKRPSEALQHSRPVSGEALAGFLRRQADWKHSVDRKVQAMRKALVKEEGSSCTFQPIINAEYSPSKMQQVSTAGGEKHLKRMEKAHAVRTIKKSSQNGLGYPKAPSATPRGGFESPTRSCSPTPLSPTPRTAASSYNDEFQKEVKDLEEIAARILFSAASTVKSLSEGESKVVKRSDPPSRQHGNSSGRDYRRLQERSLHDIREIDAQLSPIHKTQFSDTSLRMHTPPPRSAVLLDSSSTEHVNFTPDPDSNYSHPPHEVSKAVPAQPSARPAQRIRLRSKSLDIRTPQPRTPRSEAESMSSRTRSPSASRCSTPKSFGDFLKRQDELSERRRNSAKVLQQKREALLRASPKITPFAKSMDKTELSELAFGVPGKRDKFIADKKAELESKEKVDCTFKPKLTPYASTLEGELRIHKDPKTLMSRIKTKLLEDQRDRERAREIIAQHEQGKCSFSPSIHSSPSYVKVMSRSRSRSRSVSPKQ